MSKFEKLEEDSPAKKVEISRLANALSNVEKKRRQESTASQLKNLVEFDDKVGAEKRRKRSEYDQLRKEKIKFLKEYCVKSAYFGRATGLRVVADTALEEAVGESSKPGQELAVPPLSDERAKLDFYLKKVWDHFTAPILDYENLEKDIGKSGISNKKKKSALRELAIERKQTELWLEQGLRDWDKNATIDAKQKYLRNMEKLFKYL